MRSSVSRRALYRAHVQPSVNYGRGWVRVLWAGSGPCYTFSVVILRLLPLAVLAATLVVPAEAACCAGFWGCPTAAAQSAHCCEAAMDDPAAKRCCDGAASSELSFIGAKSHDVRIVATPPAAMTAGQEIKATLSVGREGRSPPPSRSHEPLYTLHSALLI